MNIMLCEFICRTSMNNFGPNEGLNKLLKLLAEEDMPIESNNIELYIFRVNTLNSLSLQHISLMFI